MSEAIWLAGSSLLKTSREIPRAWLDRFLTDSRVQPEWITAAHVIQPGSAKTDSEWNLSIQPFRWKGAGSQAHFLLAALCRELRAGEHELALVLEKDLSGWTAALLATPAFFGARNRMPAVLIAETGIFPQADPGVRSREQKSFLQKSSIPSLPENIPLSPTTWLNKVTWSGSTGLLRALNDTAAIVAAQQGGRSALQTTTEGEPTLITLLEGL
jgi:hypothetical protein